MYIKKVRKSNPNSRKVYEYLHLVENIRTEKGPRQRLVLNLGTIDVPPDQYKELANCIEAMLTGQQQLFAADPEIEKHAQKALQKIRVRQKNSNPVEYQPNVPEYQNVDVSSLQAGEIRSLGPEYVCHCIWKELKFDDILLANGVSRHILPLLEALVVGRLVSPGSERHTWQWAENRSAIYELTGTPLRPSLNSLYRAGDSLFNCNNALEDNLARQETTLFSLPERMCLFDLTNTYFEGRASGNPKAQRGRSKEKRSDCMLLTLALVIDEQGFPKYSHLYPGNQAECKTLQQIIENLIHMCPNLAKDRTVVIDAGIATKKNIAYLQENQFHYIVVNRGKADFTVADTNQMKIIRQTDEYTLEVKRREKDGQALLLCRSSARKSKDYGIRSRQERLFIERLQYYHDGLDKKGRTKNYARVLEMIGRLREKYPQASKQYDVEVVAQDKSDKARAIIWKKRAQFDEIGKFDGCYVLRTDRLAMTDTEIWETYVMLTRVENAFRSMKSSLGLRPNFHQTPDRADAHMFISVLAYHILHTIEYKLRRCGDHRNWTTIRNILSTHHRLTMEYNVKEQDQIQRHHLRLCSNAEPEHKQIYQRLELKEAPLPRKLHTAK